MYSVSPIFHLVICFFLIQNFAQVHGEVCRGGASHILLRVLLLSPHYLQLISTLETLFYARVGLHVC